ncbi:MAG: aldo/keto reductase [Patescibacteria group bacterium]|nr:aldo/keto reductase [Patescibacteria group bacterium]
MAVPTITLGNYQIPQVGLGVWQVENSEQFQTAFTAAVGAGYRHFDSAQVYKNEQMLGDAWVASGLKREELFLTTKVWLDNFPASRLKRSVDESLQKLQTEYIDLLLLHFPVTGLRKGAWKALEAVKASGKVRNIGVSNYTIRHLEGMKKYATEMPVINQVELHVFLQQPELVDYCRENGIVLEAYSPLAHGKDMKNEIVQQLADKYGKSYAQIMLRWCIEEGMVVLPKSVTPSRIEENIALFDFALSSEDLQTLKTCDRNLRTCWSPVRVP